MYDLEAGDDFGQQIIQIILASSDAQTMLSGIARELGAILNADACLILAQPDRGAQAKTGFWQDGSSVAFSPELTTCVLSDATFAKIVGEIEEQGTIKPQEIRANKAPNALLDCLASRTLLVQGTRDRANGLIILGRAQARSWSKTDKKKLQNIASWVALACDRARLQQQVGASNRYQILLNHLSNTIRSASDLPQILKSALEETAQALQLYRGWVVMLKYTNPLYQSRDRQDIPKATVNAIEQWSAIPQDELSIQSTFTLADSPLFSQAWSCAPQPFAIFDCSCEPILENIEQLSLGLDPAQSRALLFAPLMGRKTSDAHPGTVLGFLVFEDRYPRTWQPEELDLIAWISSQVSSEIIHHQALRRVQSMVDERTAQLTRSLEVKARLSEKMRQQIEELKQLNQMKDSFLSTVQDELKHPLTKMKMSIEMLKIAPEGDRQQSYFKILEDECSKEINLINDLLTLQQLDSKQFKSHPQQIDLPEVIRELEQSFIKQWQDEGFALTLAVDYPNFPLKLHTDLNSLNSILSQLLSNAGKFSTPETTVHLGVTPISEGSERFITIAVTNFGTEISSAAKKTIFKPFEQNSPKSGSGHGTGLGLALVKSLVDHLNGAIAVTSEPTDDPQIFQTTFTLTLPQTQL
ncbi:GAF domain-containing sensor histidine kinase [Lusitaniella coriacea LEGE 07157]|uniref:histidine kinase n=1 Tax=Lusitaniella coriacea LEGE 07157 TaxID=945747 RepID=A0A8J7DXA8_9CYAN|nr:GAF domain-containing sensor histidine kinase [Lusitaniella coriacea]MBE9117037.1 GAF domain-containing sensor histidine kinase [Lusitaniella coriacea LEGE 07157]